MYIISVEIPQLKYTYPQQVIREDRFNLTIGRFTEQRKYYNLWLLMQLKLGCPDWNGWVISLEKSESGFLFVRVFVFPSIGKKDNEESVNINMGLIRLKVQSVAC